MELVIVIGLLAVLGTVSVLVLNPAQLFAQARDTTRIQDLAQVNSAIGLYLSTVSSPTLQGGAGFTCTSNWGSSVSGSTKYFAAALAGGAIHAGVFAVDGTGWVAVPLSNTVGGSPLSTLPRDPTNSTTYNYQYSCNNTTKTYELDAQLESTRYTTAPDDKVSTDGGDNLTVYEVGTNLAL